MKHTYKEKVKLEEAINEADLDKYLAIKMKACEYYIERGRDAKWREIMYPSRYRRAAKTQIEKEFWALVNKNKEA